MLDKCGLVDTDARRSSWSDLNARNDSWRLFLGRHRRWLVLSLLCIALLIIPLGQYPTFPYLATTVQCNKDVTKNNTSNIHSIPNHNYLEHAYYGTDVTTAICVTGKMATFNTSKVFDSQYAAIYNNPSLKKPKIFVVSSSEDLAVRDTQEKLKAIGVQAQLGIDEEDEERRVFWDDRACLQMKDATYWQAYRSAKCLELVQQYEQTNNMRFDRFIRMRPDIYCEGTTDHSKLNSMSSWTMQPFWGDIHNPHVHMNDIYIVSSRAVADALYAMETHWPCPISESNRYKMEIMWSSQTNGGSETYEWYLKQSMATAYRFGGSPYWGIHDFKCYISRAEDWTGPPAWPEACTGADCDQV